MRSLLAFVQLGAAIACAGWWCCSGPALGVESASEALLTGKDVAVTSVLLSPDTPGSLPPPPTFGGACELTINQPAKAQVLVYNYGSEKAANVTVTATADGFQGSTTLPEVASETTQVATFKFTPTKQGSSLTFTATASTTNDVNPSNNSLSVTYSVLPPAHIDVALTGGSVQPAKPVAFTPVTVTVTAKNLGNRTVRDVPLQLYVNGTAIGSEGFIASLDPGESGTGAMAWTPQHSGRTNLSVQATVPGDEKSSNNTWKTTVTVSAYHDVAVTGMAVSPTNPTAGGKASVSVTVRNNGSDRESSVTVTLTASPGGKIGSKTVKLAPGAETTIVFSGRFPAGPTATYGLTAQAKPVRGEANTADNSVTTNVTVQGK